MKQSPLYITPAVMWCSFFGAFGFHCFYVGRMGRGFAMIAVGMCTAFIGSLIWAIFDFSSLTGRNFKDGQGRILQKW